MRRTALALFFLGVLVFSFQRQATSQSNLTQKLTTDVYWRAAEPDKQIIANAGWVVFRDYVLVIDANYPWGARAIIDDIRKTTNKPIKFVFDTHYHGDHAHGNGVFVDAGATVVCSADCMEESVRKNTAAAWNNAGEKYKTEKLEHPQIGFPEKLVFDDGQHRVELIKVGPGHTKGDSVAWLPKERILFTGDLCVYQWPGNNVADPDADPEGWLRALDRIAALDVARLVPGHGVLGDRQAIAGQKAYLSAMIDGVKKGIASGATAESLAANIDLSANAPWSTDKTRNATAIRAIHAKLSRK